MSRDRKSTRLNSSHTVIYTLSLHDALPIFRSYIDLGPKEGATLACGGLETPDLPASLRKGNYVSRSEEHTSELQSHSDLHSFPTRRSSDLPQLHRPGAERRRHACVWRTGNSRPASVAEKGQLCL